MPWVEVMEGPGLRWFGKEKGGGWRYNHKVPVWDSEGWRIQQVGPCWVFFAKIGEKVRRREDDTVPIMGSILEALMCEPFGIGEPCRPRKSALRPEKIRKISEDHEHDTKISEDHKHVTKISEDNEHVTKISENSVDFEHGLQVSLSKLQVSLSSESELGASTSYNRSPTSQ